MGLRKIFKMKKKLPAEKEIHIGNYRLLANYEHALDEYLKLYKDYSVNFPRIAKYLEAKYPAFTIIDVGANIADTIALLRCQHVYQPIYAIEGDPVYFRYLQENVRQFDDVSIYQTFLGEHSSTENVNIDNSLGTAKISIGEGDVTHVMMLDDLVSEKEIRNIKLLKIDTDGYDLKILRGSFKTIVQYQPILFFEYDAVFLKEQGEDGLRIFKLLSDMNYNQILYYDNYGRFLLSAEISNEKLLKQLYAYIDQKKGAFPYYDVCVFHRDDDLLAEQIIEKEMEFYSDKPL